MYEDILLELSLMELFVFIKRTELQEIVWIP